MARGKSTHKRREAEGDKLYDNLLVNKFINNLMKHGKKSPAQKVFYASFELISKKEQDPLQVFEQALQNVGPRQEVKPRRVGGASYQVPQEVRNERRISLAIRWIIEAARARSNKEFHGFEEKLAAELMDAAAGTGAAMKKRDSVQRMADANRAFSHFRY